MLKKENMSCCPVTGNVSIKDAGFNTFAAKSGSVCKLCVTDLNVTNLNVGGSSFTQVPQLPMVITPGCYTALLGLTPIYDPNSVPQLYLRQNGDGVLYKFSMVAAPVLNFRLVYLNANFNPALNVTVTIPGSSVGSFVLPIPAGTSSGILTSAPFSYAGGDSTISIVAGGGPPGLYPAILFLFECSLI